MVHHLAGLLDCVFGRDYLAPTFGRELGWRHTGGIRLAYWSAQHHDVSFPTPLASGFFALAACLGEPRLYQPA
jgi:hypothetical protein